MDMYNNKADLIGASAEVTHPAKQGLAQIISVYIDTLMICTATVFILLLTGVYKTDDTLNGIPLVRLIVVLGTILSMDSAWSLADILSRSLEKDDTE